MLFMVTVSNIYHAIPSILLEARQLAPLNRMLANIKSGIKSGQMNENNRLYIDDDIVNLLPPMCWNSYMGRRFMKRTYQWIFNKKEIGYFSDAIEDASWAIDKNDFSIISKTN